MQESVISCQLFNTVLDDALISNEFFKSIIDKGSLISFADDILAIAFSNDEAILILDNISKLDEYGLKINLIKT